MPTKKKGALPESPLSRLASDPMRFLYGTGDSTANGKSPQEPSQTVTDSKEEAITDIGELKHQLVLAQDRARKAEKRVAALEKQMKQKTTPEQQFADPYGDEFEWMLRTEQGHSTLRTTPVYNRVYEHVQRQMVENVGVSIATPQFIGLACCAVECLLQAADVDWQADFHDLRDKVTARHQTTLMKRFFAVLRRGIKAK